MPFATRDDISIYYETEGDPSGAPLLMVMGLGGQHVAWPQGFLDKFIEAGYFVIRYDNRDVGLSTKLDDSLVPDVAAFLGGDTSTAAYFLADMAADAAAVLDAVGLDDVHVLGISMGGMIAQSIAIGYPDRTRTLTSIMSTTGNPLVGQPTPEAVATLLVPPVETREQAIEQSVSTWRVISSPGFPFDEAYIRDNAAHAYDRCYYPLGTLRQMAAILASPDRTESLATLEMPTLVIHGDSDVLVTPSGGRATHEAIPGSSYVTFEGMGHDLPEALWDEIASAVFALHGLDR